ncbi:hypothetical protein QCA50_018049 [Cerrena zonata]|uniref:Peptidase A1 domain-containing protein n=1 Tax=Cerrena zonata TaxID=2478898 RepID=A0AAW0FL35_9APHY
MPTYQLDIMEPCHSQQLSHRFFSLALKCPGLNKIPSLLGISCHPLGIISDPSQIKYAALQNEQSGDFYWKAEISALTVYVNREAKPVWLTSASASGGPIGQPTAVVDSGMPIILVTPDIANGIYGALGIGPGSDGQYYVDCTTPINMTITLDNRPEIPLHPLDLTTACIGIIQAYPAGSAIESIADIILSVPFMRSTYTVMAYDQPDSNGTFPNATASTSSGGSISSLIRPRLGLLSLTDPTVALDEFNTIRVLKQPLGTGNSANGGAQGGKSTMDALSGKKIIVGIAALIGLLRFFALCFVLFTARWAYPRRRYRCEHALGGGPKDSEDLKTDDQLIQDVAY